jgi:signal transduction histidine kinase
VAIFFGVFGICLVALAVALQVGWILFSLESIALLIFGSIFFAAIITGLVLNTIFLIREIRRNEQHDAFINAVTHELKTPVASLRLYLETLKSRKVTEEKRQEFYDTMLSDTERLQKTIEQVLQAGKVGNRNRQIDFSNVDINEIVQNSIAIVRSRYNADSDHLQFTKNGNFMVNGSANELQTAFVNLLDNAVKYSTSDVRVRVEIETKNNKWVAVKIKDSGIGISKAELRRIFRRFYRSDRKLPQRVKGTGLGLFIVDSIVRRHGGQVYAESDGEGKGSTFIVELPGS